MEWESIKDHWTHFRWKVQKKWEKLTDADLDLIGGRRARFEAKIRQRYGFAPDHIRKEVDDWVRCVQLDSHVRSVLYRSDRNGEELLNGRGQFRVAV